MINKGLLQRIAALSFLRAAGYDGTEYRVQMNMICTSPGTEPLAGLYPPHEHSGWTCGTANNAAPDPGMAAITDAGSVRLQC